MPGTMSPRAAVRTPSGPSRTTVPPRTSRTVQPAIVVGLVSGTATRSRAGEAVFAKLATGEPAASPESRILAGDVPSAFAGGTGETDDVLRAPSLLLPGLISASFRGVSVGAMLKTAVLVAHVHPSPRPTSRAPATMKIVVVRSPPGFNSARTSS